MAVIFIIVEIEISNYSKSRQFIISVSNKNATVNYLTVELEM